MLPVRKKDKVLVISGKDVSKRGEVVKTFPESFKAIVSKINIGKKHLKATRSQPGEIREIEQPLHVSKLMLVCPKCDQPTRPKFDKLSDGKKIRICRKCGEMII